MTSATKEEAPRSPRESASRKPLSEQAPDPDDLPPGGPHAEPHLTNPDATPGAGALTPAGDHPQNRFDERLNATCAGAPSLCGNERFRPEATASAASPVPARTSLARRPAQAPAIQDAASAAPEGRIVR